MASPKNWERKQEKENSEIIFYWEHESGEEAVVVEDVGDYQVYQKNLKQRDKSFIEYDKSKNKARKEAVIRMKRNSKGFDTTTRDRYYGIGTTR